MKRFAPAVIASVLACLVAGYFLSSNLFAQRTVGRSGTVALTRRASFTIANNASSGSELPRVNGVGGFPVRLMITDSGQWTKQRKLQVFVALYEQISTSNKVGKLLNLRTDPDVLVTEADEQSEVPFSMDIRTPPGDYVAYVFLCDPETPYTTKKHPTFPDIEEFPGTPKMGKCVLVHVD